MTSVPAIALCCQALAVSARPSSSHRPRSQDKTLRAFWSLKKNRLQAVQMRLKHCMTSTCQRAQSTKEYLMPPRESNHSGTSSASRKVSNLLFEAPPSGPTNSIFALQIPRSIFPKCKPNPTPFSSQENCMCDFILRNLGIERFADSIHWIQHPLTGKYFWMLEHVRTISFDATFSRLTSALFLKRKPILVRMGKPNERKWIPLRC